MALSMIVSIPDLAQIYMEPMETANSNLHAYMLTHPHHNAAASAPCECESLISQEAHLSSATTGHGWE